MLLKLTNNERMLRITFLAACLMTISAVNSQTVLFECGQNSGTNFNGWYISPYATFDAIEFNEQSTQFFSELGGTYSVSLTKEIEVLTHYQELSLLFNFEVVDHAQIEQVVYYTSTNGKTWTPLQDSKNNAAIRVFNDSLDIRFVRAEVQATFFDNGKIECNYIKIEGNSKKASPIESLPIREEDLGETFFIFNHAHMVNIETGLDEPYELLITSITGQIVYREKYEGPQRVELPADFKGIYILSIIQKNEFQASKKIVL